ncbi:hypothetical protein BDBG_00903, partial [Blastomyces gilchristii SLH14081]
RLGRAVHGWDLALMFGTSKTDRVFTVIALQISSQSRVGDLPKSRRLAHRARSLHLTICMAIGPGVVSHTLVHVWLDNSTTTRGMQSAMGSKCSYDRGLFDGSIGGFLFERLSEFVVGRL